MKHTLTHSLTFLLVGVVLLFFFSCSNTKKDELPRDETSTVLPESGNEVTVITLQCQPFNHELVSNGKITANAVAELYFESAEIITRILVKNGDRVKKGQVLAELDTYRLNNKLVQTRQSYESAKLELQDVLIGQGFAPEEPEKVPAEVMQLAKVKSGVEQSKAQYELAQYELAHAKLTAPFDGVVANLFSKPHNMTVTSAPFCSVIDTRRMEVDFTVLESELPLIKNGDKVQISPYADISQKYSGSISEINPLVDEKGMVSVKARVDGNHSLFTGMNVHISVFRSLKDRLVIPKSAVVLRSGKQVAFTLREGKAHWNYVHTGLENSDYCTVLEDSKETLKEGDIVIVSGNINLAHESPVTVTEQQRHD